MFFLDMMGHIDEERIKQGCERIKKHVLLFRMAWLLSSRR